MSFTNGTNIERIILGTLLTAVLLISGWTLKTVVALDRTVYGFQEKSKDWETDIIELKTKINRDYPSRSFRLYLDERFNSLSDKIDRVGKDVEKIDKKVEHHIEMTERK